MSRILCWHREYGGHHDGCEPAQVLLEQLTSGYIQHTLTDIGLSILDHQGANTYSDTVYRHLSTWEITDYKSHSDAQTILNIN